MTRLPVSPRFALLSLLVAWLIVRVVAAPTFTDAYYHFNAATRLASGMGLSDMVIWQYVSTPAALPAPSHLYWMPLTSLTAAAGMTLLNSPGDHTAAQFFFVPMLAFTACVGFWLGNKLGGTPRHARLAGLLTLCSSFFVRFWGSIDTFTPYAFVGSLCLLALGLALERGRLGWWVLAGAAGALGHLTRADGMLLPIVGVMLCAWLWDRIPLTTRVLRLFILLAAYLVVIMPWFLRNSEAVGSPLPLGGTQAIWFDEYNDLFNYSSASSPATLFANGFDSFIASRWEALTNNFSTFVAVEGMVILAPLMLIGLWKKRYMPLLRPFWLYALALHLAMTFVFPFPGYRGGLFHSAAALVPFWMALAVIGLDEAVDWVAARRRRWNARTAKTVFSIGIFTLALALSIFVALTAGAIRGDATILYAELDRILPADARLMANDPSAIYYYIGRGGVVLPNDLPEIIPEIANRYEIGYLLIQDELLADGTRVAAIPAPLDPVLSTTPAFLTPIPLEYPYARLYAIELTP
jgi:4-amino-4-deoxy-L-arabinose transferase-like glycosyltransferase